MSDDKFNYSYSAPTPKERREIESIRKAYIPKERGKLDRLRSLDKKVKTPALCTAIILGIAGVLIFGTGLTMILEWNIMAGGIAVSLAGAVLMGIAYPINKLIYDKRRKKYGDEIIALSEELLNE